MPDVVLALAPHPDDAEIHCGGALAHSLPAVQLYTWWQRTAARVVHRREWRPRRARGRDAPGGGCSGLQPVLLGLGYGARPCPECSAAIRGRDPQDPT